MRTPRNLSATRREKIASCEKINDSKCFKPIQEKSVVARAVSRKASVINANFRFVLENVINAKTGTGNDTQAATASKKYSVPRAGMEISGLMVTKAQVTAPHRKVREKKSESGI